MYNSGQFALSRNFRLQSIGDSEWLQKNYNFDNVSFHIDELLIFDVSEIKKRKKNSPTGKKLSENILYLLQWVGVLIRLKMLFYILILEQIRFH